MNKTTNKSALLFFCTLFFNVCWAMDEQQLSQHFDVTADPLGAFFASIKSVVNAGEPVSLAQLPLFKDMLLPDGLKKILYDIKIVAPKIISTDEEYRLTGEIELFGVNVRAEIIKISRGLSERVNAFVVGIPKGWKISEFLNKFFGILPLEQLIPQIQQIKPNFKASDIVDLELEHGALIFSNGKLKDKQFGEAEKGVNLVCGVKFLGLAQPISTMFGTNLNELELRGTLVVPAIEGSEIEATLPGKLRIIPGLETVSTKFGLSFEGMSATVPYLILPGVFLKSGFTVTPEFLPFLKEPISMTGKVGLYPQKGEFALFSSGMLHDVVPGIDIGNLGIGWTTDWAMLASSALPISGLSARGSTTFLNKTFDVAGKFSITPNGGIGDVIFDGSMQGKISLVEFIDSVAQLVQIQSRGTGAEIDLRRLIPTESVPNISLEDPQITIVPKTGDVAGKKYYRGVAVKGKMQLFDARGELDVTASSDGVTGYGNLSPIIIKNLANNSPLLTITSATNPQEGASVALVFNAVQARMVADGISTLNILGGISSSVQMAIKMSSLSYHAATKIMNQFDATLDVDAHVGKLLSAGITPDNCFINIAMQQSFLSYLEQEIKKVAQTIVPSFNRDAQQEMDRIEGEIARLDAEMAQQYSICEGSQWNWAHDRCTIFWGEISSRNIQKGGLLFYRDAVLKPGVAIARGLLSAASDISQLATNILARGINIKRFLCEAKLSEFVQAGLLPRVTIALTFLGKDIELKNLQFNFNDIPGSLNTIIGQLGQFFK